jgi:hypothetical protein
LTPAGVFGITDPWVVAGYALAIGLAILCILYGLLSWNRGTED